MVVCQDCLSKSGFLCENSGVSAVNNSVETVKVYHIVPTIAQKGQAMAFYKEDNRKKTPFVMQKAEKGEPLKKLA